MRDDSLKDLPSSDFASGIEADDSDVPDVCFLPGTLIRMENGEKPVEDLKPGDRVVVLRPDENRALQETIEAIRWVGHAQNSYDSKAPLDESGLPVCVAKDALGENMPSQDLFITSEHSLFFHFEEENEMGLVPVRTLVNEESIYYDKKQKHFTYWHFELETHGLVYANNVLTVTWLDTGSRSSFTPLKGSYIPPEGTAPKSWEDAVVPLQTRYEFLEPLWEKIAGRPVPALPEKGSKAYNPDLRVITPEGDVLLPHEVPEEMEEQFKDKKLFLLPAGCDEVRLISRTARPCDIEGPTMDDRRKLGVLFDGISLFDGTEEAENKLEDWLKDTALPGWWGVEIVEMRWTNGDALLLLPSLPKPAKRFLICSIAAAGPYEKA